MFTEGPDSLVLGLANPNKNIHYRIEHKGFLPGEPGQFHLWPGIAGLAKIDIVWCADLAKMGTRIRLGEAGRTVGARALGGGWGSGGLPPGNFVLFRCVLGAFEGYYFTQKRYKYVGF